MSLLLLFRPRAGVSGDQTVTHTPGILSLVGGTHSVNFSGSVTHTVGPLALSGGTHSVNLAASITHTAGILVLAGGTHTPDNGEEVIQRELPKMGVGI
jgi:hypothetical protein